MGGQAQAKPVDADVIPDDVLKAEAERKKAEEEAAKAAKDPKAKKKPAKPKEGWIPALKAGFNFAFAQNQGVVGIPDGVTLALGLNVQGDLMYRKRTHEWVSKLVILHTQTKIPNIDPFIKAADMFELSSLYQYRFPKVSWLGLFAGLRLQSALLPGAVVRDTDIAVSIKELDGTFTPSNITAQKAYRLTGPFAPLFFKQFAGALAKPLMRPWMNIDFKLGIGAVEVWTRDGVAAADDAATADVLEMNRLQDYVQAGVEAQLGITGVFANKILNYGIYAEVMYPFAHNAETDLEGAELINTEFRFTLGIKLFSWASLNYSLSVLRVPLIVDKWQVTNNLMLSITANLVK
jgi:hypothetical protein